MSNHRDAEQKQAEMLAENARLRAHIDAAGDGMNLTDLLDLYQGRATAAQAEVERLRSIMGSRWVVLRRTSNSGKTLHMCLSCERVTPLPDKVCGGSDCHTYQAT